MEIATPQNQNFVTYITTNKSNIPYEDGYTINLDNLILILKSKTKEDFNFYHIDSTYNEDSGFYSVTDSIKLKQKDKNEKNFNNVFSCYLNSELVCEISTDCKIKGKKHLVKLNFENNIFYTGSWFSIYAELTAGLNLILNNISYTEIAFDSHNKHQRYKELYHNSSLIDGSYHQPTYKPVNKTIVSSLHNSSEFLIGQQRNGKQISIYNKTKANIDQDKPYISSFYQLNGLDVTQQIDRIELRLFNNFLKRYNVTLEMLATQQGLESLFLTYCKDSLSYFDLRTKAYDSSRNYHYQRIDLIDFSTFAGKELVRVPTQPATTTSTTRNTKIAFKRLFCLYIAGLPLSMLENFISLKPNYLSTETFDSFWGNLDLETENRELYRKFTRQLVREYEASPTPEVLARLASVETELFFTEFEAITDLRQELEYLPF